MNMSHTDMSHTDMLPMIIISVIAGLLSTMNVWAIKFDDIRFHLNDIYMAFLMTSWMVTLDSIYHKNITLVVIGILCISLFIYLIRNQVFIDNTQFMKGMIPHHSMAILMAEKIKQKSDDKNVISLANNIIETQNKEIDYMKKLGY